MFFLRRGLHQHLYSEDGSKEPVERESWKMRREWGQLEVEENVRKDEIERAIEFMMHRRSPLFFLHISEVIGHGN